MWIFHYHKAIYTERVHGALHMLRAAIIVLLIGLLPSHARAEEPIVTPMPERQPTRCEHIEAQVGNEKRCLEPKDSFRDCPDCPEMVVVPSGKFTMGSPENEKDRLEDEGPQHEVTIARPFAVGKTDVTFAEWDVCIAAGACPKVFDNGLAWAWGDQPVILVSWEEANGYAAWLKRMTGKDYRLLSETEWEYAARAGNQGRWSFGDDEHQVHDYAWFRGNSSDQIHPVAKKKPSAFGLYDMHGNVWQWVEDCYHNSYQGAPSNGSQWVEGCSEDKRVVRGGSWFSTPDRVRSALRYRYSSYSHVDNVGFRVGRTLTP